MGQDMQQLQELLGGPERVGALLAQFKAEVHDRAKEFDLDDNLDWCSITFGWAIAKGLKPESAIELTSYIRYHTELG